MGTQRNETHVITWGRNYMPLNEWPNGGLWLVGGANIKAGWNVAISTVASFLTDPHNDDATPGTGASINRLDGCDDGRDITCVLLANDDTHEWPWVLQTPRGRFGTNDPSMAAAIVDYATDRDGWGFDAFGNAAGE